MWWQPDQLSPTWLLPPLRRNRWCRSTWQFRSSERDWRCQLRRILATLSTWKTPNGQGEITTNIHSVLVQNSFKDVQWTSSFLQRLLTINLFFIPKYQTRFFCLIQPRPHGNPHVLHLDNPKNTPNNVRQLQSTKRWSASDPMCRLLGLGHRRVMEVYEHHMHHMHHSLTNLRNTHIDLYR